MYVQTCKKNIQGLSFEIIVSAENEICCVTPAPFGLILPE